MAENAKDAIFEYTLQIPKISHSEGLQTFEKALQYFEQGPSVRDFLFLRRLRVEAAERIVQFLLSRKRNVNLRRIFPKLTESVLED
ncbi:hypothetical protein TNCV_2293211 [Trichonephila clavipes]|nr:hypothetical protein TNCV_2293211 [Trichonephila clavipes]